MRAKLNEIKEYINGQRSFSRNMSVNAAKINVEDMKRYTSTWESYKTASTCSFVATIGYVLYFFIRNPSLRSVPTGRMGVFVATMLALGFAPDVFMYKAMKSIMDDYKSKYSTK